MEFIIPFIRPYFSCILDPIRQQIGYFNARRNVENMVDAMKDLKARRSDVETEIEVAKKVQKQSTSVVKRWLEKVEKAEGEAARIKSDYEQTGCRFFGDCSLNCKSSHTIGRRASKLHRRVAELETERGNFQVLTKPVLPESIEPIPNTSSAVGMGLQSNLERIHGYLNDESVGIVGIWGMGGVGKTFLMKTVRTDILCRRGNDGKMLFDHVILAVASRELNFGKLHGDIAADLGLPRDSLPITIFNFLKYKKFLLLLDDLWEAVDLEAIGIPCSSTDKHKLIITTRSEQVFGSMKAQKKIRVECLQPKESWDLFVKNVNSGEEIIGSVPNMLRRAEKVAEECGGLPLALIVIGRAMSTKRTPQEWEYALISLRKSVPTVIPGMEKSLFSRLKFSYDSLPDDKIRECFLCCALWPEDEAIVKEELVQSWIGLGLVDDFDDISEAYDQGHFIVGILMEACLLEPFLDLDYFVKMHDVIRDLALWIASSDCGKTRDRWVVRAGIRLREVSPKLAERCREAECVSLMNNEIEKLPQELPNCPSLTTAVLKNNKFTMIPNGFFQCWSALTYLDLSRCPVEELPAEIGCLVKLQYLNLSFTKISSLPDDLRHLINLKYLFLGGTPVQALPTGVLLCLSKLLLLDLFPHGSVEFEEIELLERRLKALGVRVTSVQTLQMLSRVPLWNLCINGLQDSTSSQLRLSQLMNNKAQCCLQTLQISGGNNFTELVMCADDFVRNQGEIVGSPETCGIPRLRYLRLVDLSELKQIIWSGIEPSACFVMLYSLEINKCHSLKNVSWILKLPFLDMVVLRDCDQLVEVIDDSQDGIGISTGKESREDTNSSFPRLQRFFLSGLPRLVSICSWALEFSSLRFFGCGSVLS